MTNTVNKLEFYYEHEAEQFVFYRVPKILFKDNRFSKISSNAKLLYSLLLDRMSLSRKNGLIDEEKRVYIYFSIEEVMEEFGVASQKATKIVAELDDKKGCGLIHRVIQGQGRPARIYVMKYTSVNNDEPENIEETLDELQNFGSLEIENQEFRNSKNKTFENQNSGLVKSEKPDFRNSKSNDNKYNNTDYSDINPILSCQKEKRGVFDDVIEKRRRYEKLIKKNIDFDILIQKYPDVDISGMVGIMLDAVCSSREYLNINCDEVPKETVKSRLLKLDSGHIDYVVECMQKNTTKIGNIRNYLLTTLYNSYTTKDHYYRAEVNHDLYG